MADVRLEVFVDEQAVPLAQEIDARDEEPTTIHLLASGADGTPLGAGRILMEPEHPGRVHLGRLAVRSIARGTGLGARVVAGIHLLDEGDRLLPHEDLQANVGQGLTQPLGHDSGLVTACGGEDNGLLDRHGGTDLEDGGS